MTKYGMVIDISRCTACYCCFAACKDEYWDNDYPPYSAAQPKYDHFWMNVIKNERGKFPYVKAAYMPVPCMQCEKAPCVEAAQNGAVYRQPDGIVVIDPEKAAGQKQIVDSCPYRVIFWNEEKGLPQKCTFCAHRLQEGKIPRCVQACPSECIEFGDLDDPESKVAQLVKSGTAEAFHAEYQTQPNVYYIDLYKMTSLFMAGEVVLGDVDECAAGAQVTVSGTGISPVVVKTNAFGNFKVDGLKLGQYSINITYPGYCTQSLSINLDKSLPVGEIKMSKS